MRISPSIRLDADACSFAAMRPARNALRPAKTPSRITSAMRIGASRSPGPGSASDEMDDLHLARPFARERDEPLERAVRAAYPREAMRQHSAAEELPELV